MFTQFTCNSHKTCMRTFTTEFLRISCGQHGSMAAYQVTPPVKMLLPSVDLKDFDRAAQTACKESFKSYFYFSEITKQNFFLALCVHSV